MAGTGSSGARGRWEADYAAAQASGRVRDADFTTLSGDEVDAVHGPADGSEPVDRFRDVLATGGGGLSVAFDMPTLMGRDSDDPIARGEVGHCGVAIDSAADMERLFADIPLSEVTTSLTISGPAVPIFAMYVVAAERQGVDISRLDGTLQTDIYKEYVAQKEWLFPPMPHLRLVGDLLELGLSRGLDVDDFAPSPSFFFDPHIDFFEEIAKFRPPRRELVRRARPGRAPGLTSRGARPGGPQEVTECPGRSVGHRPQPRAAADRCCPRRGDPGRDVRRPALAVGHLPRADLILGAGHGWAGVQVVARLRVRCRASAPVPCAARRQRISDVRMSP